MIQSNFLKPFKKYSWLRNTICLFTTLCSDWKVENKYRRCGVASRVGDKIALMETYAQYETRLIRDAFRLSNLSLELNTRKITIKFYFFLFLDKQSKATIFAEYHSKHFVSKITNNSFNIDSWSTHLLICTSSLHLCYSYF